MLYQNLDGTGFISVSVTVFTFDLRCSKDLVLEFSLVGLSLELRVPKSVNLNGVC